MRALGALRAHQEALPPAGGRAKIGVAATIRARRGADARYRTTLYLLLAPFLLGVVVLVVLPVALSIALAFTAYDGLSAPSGAGSRNFRELAADPLFCIAAAQLALLRGAGRAAARAGRAGPGAAAEPARRGVGLYRVAVFLPTVIPERRLRADLALDLQPALRAAEPRARSARPARAGLAGRPAPPRCSPSRSCRCSRSARASWCCWPGSRRSPRTTTRPRRSTAPAAGSVPAHHPAAAGAVAAAADASATSSSAPRAPSRRPPDDRRRPLLRHAVHAAADLRERLRPLPLRPGRGDDAAALLVVGALLGLTYRAAGGWGYEDEV